MTRRRQHQCYLSALAAGAVWVTALTGAPAEAQTCTVLYSFKAPDGVNPGTGRLIGDSAGNLYGTTENGGVSGTGAVFKLNKTGETVLYRVQVTPSQVHVSL